MGRKKNYTSEFKAKVVIAAIKGEKGTAEICSEFNIPATNLVDWKNKAIENLHQIFVPENEHIKKQKNAQEQINSLHRIIGEMTIENNFLKKKLQK